MTHQYTYVDLPVLVNLYVGTKTDDAMFNQPSSIWEAIDFDQLIHSSQTIILSVITGQSQETCQNDTGHAHIGILLALVFRHIKCEAETLGTECLHLVKHFPNLNKD